MIRPCTAADFATIQSVINDGAKAYIQPALEGLTKPVL
jgi:hypothetical protein